MTPVIFKFVLPSGELAANMSFVLSLNRPGLSPGHDGVVLPEILEVVTDAQGMATVPLYPSTTAYQIVITNGEDSDYCAGIRYKFYVPDSVDPVYAQDLFLAPPPNPEPWDEEAIRLLTEAKVAAQTAAANAKTSELAAKTSETNAGTSATSSSSSAAAALASKNAAKISQDAAKASEVAAAASAASAANKQPLNANLTALSAAVAAANKGFYFTNSSGAMATYDLTAQARTFAAASTQEAQRNALGLGSSATLDYTGSGKETKIAKDMATMSKVTDGFWRGLGGNLDLRGTYLERGTPDDVTGIGFVTGFAERAWLGIPTGYLPLSPYVQLTVMTPWVVNSGTIGHTTLRVARAMGIEVVQYATSGTTWSAWSEPNVRGGANSTITSLSGLTTALSVAQGGTGGTTPAAARTGLGLGTAATGTITTSTTDYTPGNVVRMGDAGVGAMTSPPWPNTSLNDCSGVPQGRYATTGSTTDLPPGAAVGTVDFGIRNPGGFEYTMTHLSRSSNVLNIRTAVGGSSSSPSWTSWETLVKGGSNSTITSLSGLTSITSSVVMSLPTKLATFTVATLPSAPLYSGCTIMVSNAAGGAKQCTSNSTVWQITNTTTTVS